VAVRPDVHPSEEIARLHLEKIGVRLTKLTKKQADYIGVPVEGQAGYVGVPIEGPHKPEHYRY